MKGMKDMKGEQSRLDSFRIAPLRHGHLASLALMLFMPFMVSFPE